jgi:hypothetical protein
VVAACWTAGQIGKRPTQVNGCPQRIRLRDNQVVLSRAPQTVRHLGNRARRMTPIRTVVLIGYRVMNSRCP